MQSEVEKAWIEVLAHIYRAVNWRKVARGHFAYDIFEHRVEFSKIQPDVPSVLQKLCNTLGLQAMPAPMDKVRFLREHEREAMKLLRKWPKYLAMEAIDRAKQIREEKKKEKEEKKKKKSKNGKLEV